MSFSLLPQIKLFLGIATNTHLMYIRSNEKVNRELNEVGLREWPCAADRTSDLGNASVENMDLRYVRVNYGNERG